MVALSMPAPDTLLSVDARRQRSGPLWILSVVLISVAIGSLTFLTRGSDERAWYAAAESVSRFSAFVFLGFFVSGSLSYFLRAPRTVGTAEQTLLLAFVGSYAVYLAFIVARVLLTDTRTPTETLTFCAFAAIAPSVLAASAYRRDKAPPTAGWEILRRAAVIYFWLIFALGGLGHFYGPHRPDRYFGLLLVLLAGGFFMRLVAAAGRRFRIADARSSSSPAVAIDLQQGTEIATQSAFAVRAPL
jgi:hypothetical protein